MHPQIHGLNPSSQKHSTYKKRSIYKKHSAYEKHLTQKIMQGFGAIIIDYIVRRDTFRGDINIFGAKNPHASIMSYAKPCSSDYLSIKSVV